MAPTFRVYLEQTDDGPSWWADSEDVPGLFAAAETFDELREQIRLVLTEENIGDGTFTVAMADQLESVAAGEIPDPAVWLVVPQVPKRVTISGQQLLLSKEPASIDVGSPSVRVSA